jgi:hypothetical protein
VDNKINERRKVMGFKIEKEWKHNENICVVIMTGLGHRCGYVGVTSTHPFYKLSYSDILPESLMSKFEDVKNGPVGKRGIIDLICCDVENPRIVTLFDVHGGITYSNGTGKYPIEKEGIWWFGYDCAHNGDAKDLSIVSQNIREKEERYPTGGIVRSLEYCISECESLSKQLNDIRGE